MNKKLIVAFLTKTKAYNNYKYLYCRISFGGFLCLSDPFWSLEFVVSSTVVIIIQHSL